MQRLGGSRHGGARSQVGGRPSHRLDRCVRGIVVSLIAVGAGWAAAEAEPRFETPPVLDAPQLVAPWAVRGPRYRIADKVPTDGFQALFTIVSDFGTFKVLGEDLLGARLAEIAALDKLASVTKTEVYTRAAAVTGARPARATGTALPQAAERAVGVGRLFDSTTAGGRRVAEATTPPGARAGARTSVANQGSPSIVGWERERRRLAKQLGVDPYTSNHVLATRLDDVAWVSSAANLGLDVAMPLGPFSMAFPLTSVAGDLIWGTPPAELIALNQKNLRAMGVGDAAAQAFSRNRHFSLSGQTALVVYLTGFDGVAGRPDVVALANTVVSENEARFLIWAVQILTRYQENVGGITALQALGRVPNARLRGGGLLIAAGVDYVSWTRRLDAFARRPEFREVKDKTAWISGKFSPRAKQGLTDLGWAIREDVAPAK